MGLVPCKLCHRAFRSSEAACPFCGAAARRRPSRAAAKIAAGAIAGVTTIFSSIGCVYGCPGGCEPPDASAGDTGSDGSMYTFDAPADVAPETSVDAEPDVTETDAADASAD